MILKTYTSIFPKYPHPIAHKWIAIIEHEYYSNIIMLADHTGTRIDTLSHFITNGTTIDELLLDRFICKDTAFPR